MKEWEYTFDAVPKEAWINQVTRDLNGKSMESLQSNWWPGAALDPFHYRDPDSKIVRLPDVLFASPPAIIEYIDARALSSTALHQHLLSALQFGAQQIILLAPHSDQPDKVDWLEGIYTEMVTWHIAATDNQGQIPGRLLSMSGENVWMRIDRNNTTFSDHFATKHNPENGVAYKTAYQIASGGLWDTYVADVLNQLIADMRSQLASGIQAVAFFTSCILSFAPDKDYIKQIIQTRTLHVLWQNILHHYLPNKPDLSIAQLETHISPTGDESPDAYLIRASIAALAAALAGTTALCIHPDDNELAPPFYKRVNRNIHHLLHMESGLPKSTDPLAGAVAIDHYTRAWSEAIWNKLTL